jgi:UDP-glucose 4-epimerase
MKNILITGGYGFLGGRIARFLADAKVGFIYLGISNTSRLSSLHHEFETRETIWTNNESLEKVCEGIDTIIHLAGMDAIDCTNYPVDALLYNGVYTGRLLEAAIKKGVNSFFFMSTAHVYASPLVGKITEQTQTTSLHPYATSNRAGEDLVRAQTAARKINGVVIRLSNSFGAPVSRDVKCWHLLVNDLCRQAVFEKKMTLRSSGLQRRDFVPIREVCRALLHLMMQPVQVSDIIFNVGGNWAPTVIEVTQYIASCCENLFGFLPSVHSSPAFEGEQTQPLHFSIDKLLSTGFIPRDETTQEINELLQYCKTHFL